MKTISRILIILMIGAFVSGALYLTLENTSIASSSDGAPSFDQMPASLTGDLSAPPTRPEGGDHDSVSLSRGLSEVGASLAKLTGITLFVLLVQKMVEQMKKRRANQPGLR